MFSQCVLVMYLYRNLYFLLSVSLCLLPNSKQQETLKNKMWHFKRLILPLLFKCLNKMTFMKLILQTFSVSKVCLHYV